MTFQAAESAAKADEWTPIMGHLNKKWEDGNAFDGTWALHKPHRGLVTFPDGSTYEGALRNGLFQGIGLRTYASGAKYHCMYQKGKRQGRGKFDDGKGNVYEGMYFDDMCHGKGSRTWPDGRSYVGDWKENHATGKGIEKRPRAANATEVDTYEGDFFDGVREGRGKMVYHEGHVYEGEWTKGLRQGKGKFVWKEDKDDQQEARFEGRFEGGIPIYGQLAFGETGITVAYPGEIERVEPKEWMSSLARAARNWWEEGSERKARDKAEVPEKCPFADQGKKDLLVSECLTEEMWKNMSGRVTKDGMRITQCVAPGMTGRKGVQIVANGMPNTAQTGIVAADADSYVVFRELFDEVVAKLHEGYNPVSDKHKTVMDDAEVKTANIDSIVTSCKITVRRSLMSFPAALTSMSVDDKAEVEGCIIKAINKMKKTEQWTAGDYFPMEGSDTYAEKSGGSSPEELALLKNEGILFDQSNCFDIREFAQGRGIFRSTDKSLVVHVNKDEHAEFVLSGSSIKDAFGKLVKLMKGLDAHFKADKNGPGGWASSDALGFITSCPHTLGAGMVMQLSIKAPKISKRPDLSALAEKAIFSASVEEVKGDTVQLVCTSRLGMSELDIVNAAVDGTNWLTKHERHLQSGPKTLWLWDEHPHVIITGPPGSQKRDIAKHLAGAFGLEYISTGDILAAEADSGSEAGLVAKEHMHKGHYVPTDVVSKLVCDRIVSVGTSRGWVVEGFPRTKAQAEALVAAQIVPNKTIILELDGSISMERCKTRKSDPATGIVYSKGVSDGGEEIDSRLIQRSDDANERAIQVRLGQHKVYAQEIHDIPELKDSMLVLGDALAEDLCGQAATFLAEVPPVPPEVAPSQ